MRKQSGRMWVVRSLAISIEKDLVLNEANGLSGIVTL
jgi:hypothetical protein